jgi:tetratricopeptide (TPR) repeat protein
LQTASEYTESVVSDNPFKDVYPALIQHPVCIAIKATPTTSSLPMIQIFQPKDKNLKPFFTSTSSTRRANNPEHTPKNETAYVFYGAVNNHGLPLAVMMDGRVLENQAVQGSVAKILEVLEKLEGSNFIKKEIEDDIKIQYENLKRLLNDQSGVSFSAVALYKDSLGQLKSISFGTGDTMVALSDPEKNDITTVIAARKVDDKGKRPLPFPSPQQGATTFSRTLANLEIDIRTVQPNSKFIFLTEDAYAHLPCIEEKLPQDTRRVIIKTTLKADAIKPGTSLLTIAQDANPVSDEFNAEGVQTVTVKNEITAGEMIVPTLDQQKELQAFLYTQAINLFNEVLVTIDHALYQKVDAFKQRIAQMHDAYPEKIASLRKALIRTAYISYSFLNNKESLLHDISDYVSYIQEEFSSECSFLGGMSDDLYAKAIGFFDTTLETIEGTNFYQNVVAVKDSIVESYSQLPEMEKASLINALIKANYIITSYTNRDTSFPEDISNYCSYIQEKVNSKHYLVWKILKDLIVLGNSLADLYIQKEGWLAFPYYQAINSFNITLGEIKANKPDLYQKAIAVRNQIEQMSKDPSNNMASLIMTLTKTNELITRYKDGQDLSQALSDYYTHIQTGVSGKPSLGWKILGAAMIALGVTLALVGGLNFAVGNVLGGAVISGSGVALTLAGIGIFSKGRRKGLYKLTRSFADSLKEENKNNFGNNVSN